MIQHLFRPIRKIFLKCDFCNQQPESWEPLLVKCEGCSQRMCSYCNEGDMCRECREGS